MEKQRNLFFIRIENERIVKYFRKWGLKDLHLWFNHAPIAHINPISYENNKANNCNYRIDFGCYD